MDAKDLQNKVANAEQEAMVKEKNIPANETLSAKEFVEGVIKPIITLQDKVNTLEKKSVFAVKQGVTTYVPEDIPNTVVLPGADTAVYVQLDLAGDPPTIVSTTGRIKLGMRITSIAGTDTFETVTVAVMVAAIGSTDWMEQGRFNLNAKSSTSKEWDIVDLTKYVGTGTKQVQFIATGQRTGVSGYSVPIVATITNMYLTNQRNYDTPIYASQQNKRFPVDLMVYGAVAKTLHIRISGAVQDYETTAELGVADDAKLMTYNFYDETAYSLLAHGVHRVEAWLTCSDGQGGTLESEHVVNRFMVVNEETDGADLLKPYLLIQNEVEKATNFVQEKLFDYAVYYPVRDDNGNISNEGVGIELMFLLTSYTPNYLTNPPTEYFRIEQTSDARTRYNFSTAVEIESDTDPSEYNAYIRVFRKDGENLVDMLTDAIGENNIAIKVDNSDSFGPTTGSVFLLNPKVRNNSESNPARILNARKNNAEVESEWENFGFVNDGWITNTSDRQKVLRIPAGSKINIKYNPFSQFHTNPDSSMTFELDFAVRNVINELDPIVQLGEIVKATGEFIGLKLLPMRGYVATASNILGYSTDFNWQEDQRTHVTINIHNSVRPNLGDALVPVTSEEDIHTERETVALVRVAINGGIEREMKFNTTNVNEFCTGEMSNGGIFIGQENADIDIYSIRCYENKQLSAEDIERDYRSTLPTSEEKKAHRAMNDIRTGGRIDIDKVKAIGKRILVWHGEEPYQYAQSGQPGWWEIFQYDRNGNLDREYSGTICKETKSLTATRQGSTANSYFYSNLQTKIGDAEGKITIPISDLHSSIILGEINEVVDADSGEVTGKTILLAGGFLGKNEPLKKDFDAEEGAYAYDDSGSTPMVTVPDGWIDGNGKYRGRCFQLNADVPAFQKGVNKINYASAMQSHLAGCTKAYNVLHTAVVGENAMQKAAREAGTRADVAKYTEPFFFFTQSEGSNDYIYRGCSTFGAGKMDKPTWGYVKKMFPMFQMLEGSDNNRPLTDFRVPADHTVAYDPEEEAYIYNKQLNLDFDAGDTKKVGDLKYPKDALEAEFRRVWNFVYLHAPNIRYFIGTFDQFLDSELAQDTNHKYYCTDEDPGHLWLRRYDFNTNQWVDAGLEIEEGEGEEKTYRYERIDLVTYDMTAATYAASKNKADFEKLNRELIGAIVADARKYIKLYFNEDSLKFHYCFINNLMAGTDNCSKNTYPICNPEKLKVTIDGTTHEVYQWHLHQDDVDTIGPTDNDGRNTKPYYIDRLHPFDNETGAQCYEGVNNQLFNLIEEIWEEDTLTGLRPMMRRIFTAMSSMVTVADDLPGFDGSSPSSVWGFFYKYFFATQNYFPIAAYNEQARVRYEYPAMIGYTSRSVKGGRSVPPIEQSVGCQLQGEKQYYKRRLIMEVTYAHWLDVGNDVGIEGSGDAFSWKASPLPHETTSFVTYSFTVVAHQYIYPSMASGNTKSDDHVRLAPGESYTISMSTTAGDNPFSLHMIHFYRSIGNIGDLSLPSQSINIMGKRLTEVIAVPTKFYPDKEHGNDSKMVPAFRPSSILITANNVKKIEITGVPYVGGSLDLTRHTRLQTLNIEGTNFANVVLPESTSLRNVRLNGSLSAIKLSNLPNLKSFSMQSYANVTSFEIGDNVGSLQSDDIARSLWESKKGAGAAQLDVLSIHDVNWTNIDANLVLWMTTIPRLDVTGTISIYEPNQYSYAVTYDVKKQLVNAFGNVDDPTDRENFRGLHLLYNKRAWSGGAISGFFYKENPVTQFTMKPQVSFSNTLVSERWSVSPAPAGSAWSIDAKTGLLTVSKITKAKQTATISLVVRTFEDGTYKDNTVTEQVDIYDREAEVGDFVYHDGTYGKELDEEKSVVGICFYVAPRDANGNIYSDLANPDDVQSRLMVALDDATTDGERYRFPYGPYKSTNSNGLFYNEKNGSKTYFDNEFYNPKGITLINKNIMPSGYVNPKLYLLDNESEIGIKNGGFKAVSADMLEGDGFGYNEPNNLLNERILTDDLASIAGDRYNAGDIVNASYAVTLKMIKHRNTILQTGLKTEVGLPPIPVPSGSNGKTEMQSLNDMLLYIKSVMGANGETNPQKWEQICMPSISVAYAYKPSVYANHVIDSKFTEHNWFLPTFALFTRIVLLEYLGVFSKAEESKTYESITKNEQTTVRGYGETTYMPAITYKNETFFISSDYRYSNRRVRPICAF